MRGFDSFKNLWLPTKDMEYGWEAAVIKNYLFLLLKQKNPFREGHGRQHENGFPRQPDFLNKAIKKQVSCRQGGESTDLLLDAVFNFAAKPLFSLKRPLIAWLCGCHTRTFLGSAGSVGPNFKLQITRPVTRGFSSHNYFHFHSSSLNNIRHRREYRRWEFPPGGWRRCLTGTHPSHKLSVKKSKSVKVKMTKAFRFSAWLPLVISFCERFSFSPDGLCVHWNTGW